MDIYGIRLKKATPEIKERIATVFGYGPFGKGNTITIDEDYRFGIVDFADGLTRDLADVAGDASFLFRGKILSEVVNEYQLFEGIYENGSLMFKEVGWTPIDDEDYDEGEDSPETEKLKTFLYNGNVFSKNNNAYFSGICWDCKHVYKPGEKKAKK